MRTRSTLTEGQRERLVELFEAAMGSTAASNRRDVGYGATKKLYDRCRLHGRLCLMEKPTKTAYSFEVKKEVVQRYLAGETGMNLAAEFHLSSKVLVKSWSSVRQVLFHAQLLAGPPRVRTQRVPLKDRVGSVNGPFAQFLLQYLERQEVTCARITVSSLATRLAHFGQFVTTIDPSPASPAQLTRCTHIEPYLVSRPRSPNTKSSGILSVAEQARRIRATENFLREITEWR